MTDASGPTGYTYDNNGRLTKVTNGAGAGHQLRLQRRTSSITTVTYPNGKIITRGYDNAAQRLTSVTDWNSNKTTGSATTTTTSSPANLPERRHRHHRPPTPPNRSPLSPTPPPPAPWPASPTPAAKTANSPLPPPPAPPSPPRPPRPTPTTRSRNSPPSTPPPTARPRRRPHHPRLPRTQTFEAPASELRRPPRPAGAPRHHLRIQPPRRPHHPPPPAAAPPATATTRPTNSPELHPRAGTATSYTYNGDGLRATKTTGSTTATYAWDINTGTPEMITDGSSNYIYGPGGLPVEQIGAPLAPRRYLKDQLGSTRTLLTPAPDGTATYTYDAYGNTTSQHRHPGHHTSAVRRPVPGPRNRPLLPLLPPQPLLRPRHRPVPHHRPRHHPDPAALLLRKRQPPQHHRPHRPAFRHPPPQPRPRHHPRRR